MGASYGFFSSDLSFDNDIEPAISQQMLLAAGGYRWGAGWSVRGSAGAILGGTIEHGDRRHDVATGWAAVAAVSKNWSFGGRYFAAGSFSLGVSSTSTREDAPGAMDVDLTAFDARLGALAGVTLWQRVSPYVQARAFGGPVMWSLDGEDTTGSDQYHFQLGLGTSVSLPWDLSVLVDGSFLGERALSVGVSAEL
ncbi:hypothetical protein [Haliangium sp.]|uniref:hypothetical protein n=1 Tax=Haliangium sp. TaxID=2663208 RepID=UPI003D095AC2